MTTRKINPESLRVPTKAYSQGVLVTAGDTELLFVTGQIPQDIDGAIVHQGDPEKQTRVVFSRIEEILKEAGMTFDHVVKAQIFVRDISKASVVTRIRDELFKVSRPASTLVEVSGFVKEGCFIEIEIVAAKGKSARA